ncbi:hypothetical protein GCM10010411_76130 [Actinomadura fulvescens]|uniref:Uncharacterized protein n=1 Tax=Actinomadura fulvescens TaxID=46160 RepID=A0ABP6CWQ8_9ACTN
MARKNDDQFTLLADDEVFQHLLDLPDERLQRIALLRLDRLVQGVERGRELHRLPGGLRQVFFDIQGQPGRYRIFYKELPPPQAGELPLLQVVAIGPRKALEAYLRATEPRGRPKHFETAELDPLQEADRLDRQAARELSIAEKLERQAETQQGAVDRDQGPAVLTWQALGDVTARTIARARAADQAVISILRTAAKEHREAAERHSAAARGLRTGNAQRTAHAPVQQDRQVENTQEPYDATSHVHDPPPGPSQTM